MNVSCVKLFARLMCLGACLSGCQSSDDAGEAVEATAAARTSTSAARPKPKSGGPASAKKESETAPAAVAQFSPPFPERLELFEPPKRTQGTVRRNDELGETVELKGFITVDEPRVILSIDGVISSVPEGGEKYGVQVISIQPPTVVLQRGRDRWPATLE